MSGHSVFLQVGFYCTPLFSRVLIHPQSPFVTSPDGKTWFSVTYRLLKKVPSRTLLTLSVLQLERELNETALENVNGWICHSSFALEVKQRLEKAKVRYENLRDGVFAGELRAALKELFLEDPRYQARLSRYDELETAVEEVCARALSQCRFDWEMDLLANADCRPIALRLMLEMKQALYEQLCSQEPDCPVMPSQRYRRFEKIALKMVQFRGLQPRLDLALDRLQALIAGLPEDGSALCGSRLEKFWREVARLTQELDETIESDLYEDSFEDEDDEMQDGDLYWETDNNRMIDDLAVTEILDMETGYTPDLFSEASLGESAGTAGSSFAK